MRSLTSFEVEVVSGGELNCEAGFPSGIKCSGGLSDWKAAGVGIWNFFSNIPGTAPWTVTKILER